MQVTFGDALAHLEQELLPLPSSARARAVRRNRACYHNAVGHGGVNSSRNGFVSLLFVLPERPGEAKSHLLCAAAVAAVT